MKFIDSAYVDDFKMFSATHIIGLLLFILLAALLFIFRNNIRSRSSIKKWIRYSILAALIIPEACLYLWYTLEGLWDFRRNLPLELCSITQILSVIMLFTKQRIFYHVLFFAGTGGALQAILTPNLLYPFPHILFFHFFIVHIAIILASLYMTWIENYKPSWKSIGITMIFLNVLLLTVGSFDYYTKSNYMFLRGKPSTASILDFLGPYPYYLVSEELIALLIFVVMYAFFLIPLKIRLAKR